MLCLGELLGASYPVGSCATDTSAFLGLPRAPRPPAPCARHWHLRSRPLFFGSLLSVWATPHFDALLSASWWGLGWVGVACLGGVVPGALLRSSSPALSGMRYGLEGPSANRVGVSTPLVYSPCTYIVLVSLRPGPLFHFGWQRLMNVPAASGSFAVFFLICFGLML